ncbi:MAG: DUF692 domain-containing protein [Bacteroidales bacterium]|nr:DUF692 domain-containing protein [Bacteroidales bacterium]
MNGKVGIGLRRDISKEILESTVLKPNFLEFAPENWMGMGGYWNRIRKEAVEKYPVTCHGLSLSLGSPEELDWDFIRELKVFLDENQSSIFSEHLSYTKSRNAHLYDLLPIPFRKDAVDHVVDRIKRVQDFLERPLAIENVSYYTPVAAEMTEIDFVNEIVEKAGCKLLLDVNNVYVNAFNHKYDAREFIGKLPLDRVAYIHMAGHEQVAPDLIIDTHGQPIIDPVYELFEWTIQKMDPVPVLLERDYNFNEIEQLQSELDHLKSIIKTHWKVTYESPEGKTSSAEPSGVHMATENKDIT